MLFRSLWGKRFLSSVLLFTLTWILVLWSMGSGWTQDKSGEAVGTNAQAEESLDFLGDLPHPHRIERPRCINCRGWKCAPPIRMIQAKRLSTPASH